MSSAQDVLTLLERSDHPLQMQVIAARLESEYAEVASLLAMLMERGLVRATPRGWESAAAGEAETPTRRTWFRGLWRR